MGNGTVIRLPAADKCHPQQAIASAADLGLTDVLLVDYDPVGVLAVRSSQMSRAEALWLLRRAKDRALRGGT